MNPPRSQPPRSKKLAGDPPSNINGLPFHANGRQSITEGDSQLDLSQAEPPRSPPRSPSRRSTSRRLSKNVSFRVDAATHEVRAGRAAQLKLGPNDLARCYVLQVLHEAEERAALHEAVFTLHDGLLRFRNVFAPALEALLVSAGKISPPDARGWVQQLMNEV